MMKWEPRKKSQLHTIEATPSPLPIDYLRLVEKTLTEAVDKGLSELKKIHPVSEFQADGSIYADEVLVAITLSHGTKNITATTVYASADFNPMAATPTLETILAACVEAAGDVFDFYLDPAKPELINLIAHHSLSALEEAPFEWTKTKTSPTPGAEKVSIWVKIDKSNPPLDALADKWLAENDPHYQKKNPVVDETLHAESEEFLQERLEAIKNAKSGSGNTGNSGPIRH